MSTGARSVKNANYFQCIVPGSHQIVNFTNVSAQSLAFDGTPGGEGTTILRLLATQDCHVYAGTNPTVVVPASAGVKYSGMFVKANVTTYMGVEPGQKLAVIRDTADGVLHITEGA